MLCQAQLGSRAPPINHGARQKLWKIPNIPGSVAFRPVADFGGGNGAFLFEDGSVQTAHCALNEGIRGNYKVLSFDASRTSSLYQNGLTEIRVNALYGLNLIRAF